MTPFFVGLLDVKCVFKWVLKNSDVSETCTSQSWKLTPSDRTLTYLCIFCKSFILNVNLIDQATPEGHTHSHALTHSHIHTHTRAFMSTSSHHPCLPLSHARPPPTPLPSTVVGSKKWVEWQPTLWISNQTDTHTNTKQRSGLCQLGCGGQLRCPACALC